MVLSNLFQFVLAPPLFEMTSPAHTPPTTLILDNQEDKDGSRKEAHALYALHFPIPPNSETTHDSNQRLVLLYGVGAKRQGQIKHVNEMEKKLSKLFDSPQKEEKRAKTKETKNLTDKKTEILK